MKKVMVTLLILLMLLSGSQFFVQAQISSSSSDLQNAEELKNKIASKVAELRKQDQKAVAGSITKIDKTILTIQAPDDTIYTIKADSDLTKVFTITGSTKKESSISNLSKGDYIIVSGPIDNKSISANDIYVDQQYFIGSGKVTEVNTNNYFLKVLTQEKDTYTLDIETYTKKYIVDAKTLSIDSTNLAKIKEGDTIHFTYKKTGKEQEKNRYSAQKILVIPQEYFIK